MESQDETNEMKKKLKIMTHQIDQFKEEIGNKESALVKVSIQARFCYKLGGALGRSEFEINYFRLTWNTFELKRKKNLFVVNFNECESLLQRVELS